MRSFLGAQPLPVDLLAANYFRTQLRRWQGRAAHAVPLPSMCLPMKKRVTADGGPYDITNQLQRACGFGTCSHNGRDILNLMRRLTIQRITGGSDSADHIAVAGRLQHAAQAANVNIDCAQRNCGSGGPCDIDQLFAAEHPSGMLQKMSQQLKFNRPQMNIATSSRNSICVKLHLNVADPQHLAWRKLDGRNPACAAIIKQSAQIFDQLDRRKWPHKVFIQSQLEEFGQLPFRALTDKRNHRNAPHVIMLLEPSTDFRCPKGIQLTVQHHGNWPMVDNPLQRFINVIDQLRHETISLQYVFKQQEEIQICRKDQHDGLHIPSPKRKPHDESVPQKDSLPSTWWSRHGRSQGHGNRVACAIAESRSVTPNRDEKQQSPLTPNARQINSFSYSEHSTAPRTNNLHCVLPSQTMDSIVPFCTQVLFLNRGARLRPHRSHFSICLHDRIPAAESHSGTQLVARAGFGKFYHRM